MSDKRRVFVEYLVVFAVLLAGAYPSFAQQDLCDYTAEADAADIDGFELIMGDPANSCEGYSVSFLDFLAAVETTGIDATAIDYDGDGTPELTSSATGISADPDDSGTQNLRIFAVTGGGNPGIAIVGVSDLGSAYSVGFKLLGDNQLYICRDNATPSSEPTACPIYIKPYSAFTLGNGTPLTVSGAVTPQSVFNMTGTGATGVARLGWSGASTALPTCDSTTARALLWDQDGDMCGCPPDGSDWVLLGGFGSCT